MDCSPPGSFVRGILQAKYWSGLPCPRPRDLPDPGNEPTFLESPALSGRFFTTSATGAAQPEEGILQDFGPLKKYSQDRSTVLASGAVISLCTDQPWSLFCGPRLSRPVLLHNSMSCCQSCLRHETCGLCHEAII